MADTGLFEHLEKNFGDNFMNSGQQEEDPNLVVCAPNSRCKRGSPCGKQKVSENQPEQPSQQDSNKATYLGKEDHERLENTKQQIRLLNKQMDELDEEQRSYEKKFKEMKQRRQELRTEEIRRQEELEVISQEVRNMKVNRDKMRLEKATQIRRQQELEAARIRYEQERARILQGDVDGGEFMSEPAQRQEDIKNAENLKQSNNEHSDPIHEAIKSMERNLINVEGQENQETSDSSADVFRATEGNNENVPESAVASKPPQQVQLGAFKVHGFYPNDITVDTSGHNVRIIGKYESCKQCDIKHNCEKNQFRHEFSIPESIDTNSVHATLDAYRILKIYGVKYEGLVIHPEDRKVRVLGLGIEKSRPEDASASCSKSSAQLPAADEYPKVGKVYNKPRTFVITADPKLFDEL